MGSTDCLCARVCFHPCVHVHGKEKKLRTKEKIKYLDFSFFFYLVGVYQLSVLSTTDGWFRGKGGAELPRLIGTRVWQEHGKKRERERKKTARWLLHFLWIFCQNWLYLRKPVLVTLSSTWHPRHEKRYRSFTLDEQILEKDTHLSL